MKKKSFLLPVTAFALLLTLGLAGCGGNNGGGEGGKESQQQQNSNKQEKITITAAENKTKLILGESVQLTASVDGVTWSTSDEAIATVSAAGLVESKAVGKVTIKANKDGYKEGSISISIDLEKIEITAAGETTLLAGQTVQLNASQQGVTWESAAPEVATVSDAGLVTAVKFGSAVIHAKKNGFNDGTITINVVRPEASLKVDLTTGAEHYSADGWWELPSAGGYGFSMQTVTGWNPISQAASWGQQTEEPAETFIGGFGEGDKETVKFNASKAGKAEIVVNIGNSDEVKLADVMAIKLNGNPVDLSQVTLTANAGDWGNSLAFNDLSLGELDLVAENTLVFEILADNNLFLNEVAIYAEGTVTLVEPQAKQQIAVGAEKYEVIVDETVQIVTAETGVTFVSADETIATVSDTGLVTGVKVGKVNITLKKDGMYSVRTEITVNPKPVAGQIIIEAENGAEVTTDWNSGGYMKQSDGGGMGMGGNAVHSGGAYVTYFSMGGGDVDLTLTIEFTASEAKTMVLSVVGSAPVNFMGGDASAYVFADSAEVSINGTAMTFTDQSFPAPEGYTAEMVEVVLGDVAVQAGPNTLVFHTTGAAPSLDCFKLSVKA